MSIGPDCNTWAISRRAIHVTVELRASKSVAQMSLLKVNHTKPRILSQGITKQKHGLLRIWATESVSRWFRPTKTTEDWCVPGGLNPYCLPEQTTDKWQSFVQEQKKWIQILAKLANDSRVGPENACILLIYSKVWIIGKSWRSAVLLYSSSTIITIDICLDLSSHFEDN